MKEFFKDIKTVFPEHKNIKNEQEYIRITNCTEEIKHYIKSLNDYQCLGIQKYSGTYFTHTIVYNGNLISIVMCNREFKRTKGKILQKQFTPSALTIKNSYSDKNVLENKILNVLKEKEEDELVKNMLIKLVKLTTGEYEKLNNQELKIFKEDKYLKDFSEILVGLYFLCQSNIKNVDYNNGDGKFFDIKITENSGLITKINVKTGNGSGQSLVPYHKELEDLKFNSGIKEGTKAYNYINALYICSLPTNKIESLSGKRYTGKDKILLMAEFLSQNDDLLGLYLRELKALFFKNKCFNSDEYENNFRSFNEYKNKILMVQKEFGIKENIGIPKGTKVFSPEDIYTQKDGKIKAILFLIATSISNYSDNIFFTEIMKDFLIKKVKIVNVSVNESGHIIFETPEKPKFKIHYWSSFNKPTNNLIGFKEIS